MFLGEPPATQADLHFRVFGFPVRVHPVFLGGFAVDGIGGWNGRSANNVDLGRGGFCFDSVARAGARERSAVFTVDIPGSRCMAWRAGIVQRLAADAVAARFSILLAGPGAGFFVGGGSHRGASSQRACRRLRQVCHAHEFAVAVSGTSVDSATWPLAVFFEP